MSVDLLLREVVVRLMLDEGGPMAAAAMDDDRCSHSTLLRRDVMLLAEGRDKDPLSDDSLLRSANETIILPRLYRSLFIFRTTREGVVLPLE